MANDTTRMPFVLPAMKPGEIKGVQTIKTVQVYQIDPRTGEPGRSLITINASDFDELQHVRPSKKQLRKARPVLDEEEIPAGPSEEDMETMSSSELRKLPEFKRIPASKQSMKNKSKLIELILAARNGDFDD
jgi:hypothetical protein